MSTSPPHPVRRSTPPPPSARKRILVVDDDPDTRAAIARLLESEYDVSTAADGLEGLRVASFEPHPNLVIADVAMPVVDGIVMARHMKRSRELHHVPIIFLTGQTSVRSVIEGISAGARHYLAKPVDPAVLEQKIRRALSD